MKSKNHFLFIFQNDALVANIESNDCCPEKAKQALIEHLKTKELRLIKKSETEFHGIDNRNWTLVETKIIRSKSKTRIGIKITIKQIE